MLAALLGVLLSVTLPLPFGDAEAAALVVSDDGSAVLEVTIEVAGAPAAVLVRGVGPVDELPPVALAPQGDGTYSGIVELNTTVGVLLGFEYLPSGGGTPTVTELFTLVQLGVDPAALAPRPPPTVTTPTTPIAARPPVQGSGSDDRSWGWLALAAGSGGLALLLIWFLLGRGRTPVPVNGVAARGASGARVSDKIDNLSGNPDNTGDADKRDPGADAEA